MQRRSVLIAAVLGAATLLGACGGGGTKVDAGAPPAAVATPTAPSTTPTTAATPTTVAPIAAAAVATPAAVSPLPTTATVEVHFSTAAGWHATATLRRPDGSTTAGIPVTADSPAVFSDLAPGTYAASIDAEGDSGYDSSEATLAPPLQFVRGGAFTVNPGDHVVVDCDGPSGCVVT